MNKNTIFYTGAMGVAQVFSFLALFAYTANLKPEVYALVAIFETVLLLLQSCVSFAIDRATQRFYLDKEPNKVISTSASIGLSIALFLLPLTLVGATFFSQLTLIELLILYVAATGYILHTIILVKYQFSEQPKYYFYASLTKSLSFFLSSVFFLYVFRMKEEAFLYSSLLTGFVLVFLGVWITKPHYRHLKDTLFVKEMLAYSLPFVPTLLASWVITWSSRFFMVGNVDAAEIGVFSAAQKVAMVFFIFTQAITLVATPAMYRFLKEKKMQQAKRSIIINLKVVMIIALCVAFFLPKLLSYIIGGEYRDIRVFIMLLMYVNFVSAVLGLSTSILFNFYKKTVLQMKLFLAISVLALILNTYLIPEFGVTGVIISLLIPTTILAVSHFYLVMKFLSFPSFFFDVFYIYICFVMLLLFDYFIIDDIFNGISVIYVEIILIFLLGFWFFKRSGRGGVNA